MALNAAFFRKAKKLNRAIEITENDAYIPAVKDTPEIRVPLPSLRLRTIEEREADLDERKETIRALEGEIETERKVLLGLVKTYEGTKTGTADVVVQNLKVRGLMEKRSKLARPGQWIEDVNGLNYKDIFLSKRDVRKLGYPVHQLKRRVEPIESLYIDEGRAVTEAQDAERAEVQARAAQIVASATAETRAKELKAVAATSEAPTKTAAEAKEGAIIGQKKTFKLKKTMLAVPAARPTNL